jgi:hypothetical protein
MLPLLLPRKAIIRCDMSAVDLVRGRIFQMNRTITNFKIKN